MSCQVVSDQVRLWHAETRRVKNTPAVLYGTFESEVLEQTRHDSLSKCVSDACHFSSAHQGALARPQYMPAFDSKARYQKLCGVQTGDLSEGCCIRRYAGLASVADQGRDAQVRQCFVQRRCRSCCCCCSCCCMLPVIAAHSSHAPVPGHKCCCQSIPQLLPASRQRKRSMYSITLMPRFCSRRTMQFVSAAEGHEEMRTYIRTLKGQH